MKKIQIVRFLTIVTFLVFATVGIASECLIGGVKMGETTIRDCDKLFGEGTHFTGAHPHGGRTWDIAGTDFRLRVDGFQAKGSRTGPYVESFDISHKRDVPIPTKSVVSDKRLTKGLIDLDWFRLNKSEIKARLRSSKTKYKEYGEILEITKPLKSRYFSNCTINLFFKSNHLASIRANLIDKRSRLDPDLA